MKNAPSTIGLYDARFEHESCGLGFVADIRKRESHQLVLDAQTILTNLSHRGAIGADEKTGDGAGILVSTPDAFLRKIAGALFQQELAPRGHYAVGQLFLPQDEPQRKACEREFEKLVVHYGCACIAWRKVPVNSDVIGVSAKESEPFIAQVFLTAPDPSSPFNFEQCLYLISKRAGNSIRGSKSDPDRQFYVCSLSSNRLVYKGMMMNDQLFSYYPDLQDPDFSSYMCMVHSRFSTNTFPSWSRAHPVRVLSHNGEINTVRGNSNFMRAREGTLESKVFGSTLKDCFPIIEPDASDSGMFDNTLEFLGVNGIPLPRAVLMMIPEAWQGHNAMSEERRAMYEYQSSLMEPWDGPASIVFSDGDCIGAVLDRNGLRPSRYYITHDDKVIMASEVGVLPVAAERVKQKGRLQPGRMFLVDFSLQRIINDEELKEAQASQYPYQQWLNTQRMMLGELPAQSPVSSAEGDLSTRLRASGYTREHIHFILCPMVNNAKEPLGSMGNDAPLAVLSSYPRLPYEYCKQLFAQVTNPPIDSIREKIIMSIASYIGPQGNLLDVEERFCHRLYLENPILSNEECAKLRTIDYQGWKAAIADTSYDITAKDALRQTLRRVCEEADRAIHEGAALFILSDRNASAQRGIVSPLLATGAVHHHLVRNAKRTRIAIIVESAEPREVHHFCCLFGFGADAINPYLAFDVLCHLNEEGSFEKKFKPVDIVDRYKGALAYGMRKVFAKMGISTLDSYKGAQIFEIVGLNKEVIDVCFAGATSRIGGNGFDGLMEEAAQRHRLAYPQRELPFHHDIPNFGDYQWRVEGETHMWNPQSVALLQRSVREDDYERYKEFSHLENEVGAKQATLRGFFCFKKCKSIPLEEVEPEEEILKRFVTGAMSFGSISLEAHETLAIAMNRIKGKSNTGEGGEISERYIPLSNGDSKRSAIKQVASGRFGVTIEYLSNADEIQIKMAQGAKPGEGGELPGHKVFPIIAKTRYSTPGVGLISPPPHHDIYSIEDLAQLIFDLKNANPQARISVKLVAEVGVGTIAAGVAKAHADHILISGHDGGTGASPLTGIKHAGLPWELGIAETHQTLVLNDLRSRVVLQTDGQIKTGREVIIAALLGAEECGFATGPLIAIGCIMMRKCEKNTCPVGIATQDERLRKKFTGKPEHVVRYMTFIAREAREIMAKLGIRNFNDLIGRVDLIETDRSHAHWKSQKLDLSPILTKIPLSRTHSGVYCQRAQNHGIDAILDRELIAEVLPALQSGKDVMIHKRIVNSQRTVGGMLSHELVKIFGPKGPESCQAVIHLEGSAGQSFGAWLLRGITLKLWGDANDYVGKGLSGGTLVIIPPKQSTFLAEENIIIGNVSFYGATSGKAFIRGIAAERFCVRNSGAQVVVEGVGDHGCEYMTGGRAIILGLTGRNFAAGMSGGIAYVWDEDHHFKERINTEMVDSSALDAADLHYVFTMLQEHHDQTGSTRAQYIIQHWNQCKNNFVKVISPIYREIIAGQQSLKQQKVGVNG